jgi:hypothetical protein
MVNKKSRTKECCCGHIYCSYGHRRKPKKSRKNLSTRVKQKLAAVLIHY